MDTEFGFPVCRCRVRIEFNKVANARNALDSRDNMSSRDDECEYILTNQNVV